MGDGGSRFRIEKAADFGLLSAFADMPQIARCSGSRLSSTNHRNYSGMVGKPSKRVSEHKCLRSLGLEPRRPFDPLRPMEPPSPFRPPGQYVGPRDDELARLLKEILDRLIGIENRLKSLEEQLKTRR